MTAGLSNLNYDPDQSFAKRLSSLDVDTRKTQFESKVASELWLNIDGKDFRLVGKNIRIGRALDNDIVLEHKSCSRHHALINIHGDRVLVEDLNSRNGIRVNRVKARSAELRDEAEVRIGDLVGVFYRRSKNQMIFNSPTIQMMTKPFQEIFQKSGITEQMGQFKSQFDLLDRRKKLMSISVLTIAVLASIFLFRNPEAQLVISKSPPIVADGVPIVQKPISRQAFEKCLELEDLGNYRQAGGCFRALPRTEEVQTSLERVQTRQLELSEKRYIEGTRAFENYYYDIAVLKWQEVLLISDDASEYRTKAMAGIRMAEERRRLR